MKRVWASLGVVALFTAVWAVVTWPQPRVLAREAFPHPDVYFNMWRLEWLAHAVVHAPTHLLDGNIFYPEPRTLTYSDAVPVEGIFAAPLIWAGMPPVLVQNLMIFGAMIASACAMFALVTYLTGMRGAGVVAGIAFGFAPFRFEHVMHLEMQWAMWSPLALLYLHRTIETGRLKHGLLMGAMIALQMLSSIYYGVFLATLISAAALLLLIAHWRELSKRALASLAAGAVLAAVVCAAYSVPYLRTSAEVGERTPDQIQMFSARPSQYLVATPDNWLYGSVLQSRGRPERRLFPGALIGLLAMIGLLLRAPSARAIVYLLLLVAAFEMSLGFGGHIYAWLYTYVPGFRALRAAARLGLFVLLFISVLGGYGYAAITYAWGRRARTALAVAFIVVLAAEYRVSLPHSREYPNDPPPLYRVLSHQPAGIVAELPVPNGATLPGPDPRYVYCSTFHWFPLVNGYSGMYPGSYLRRIDRLRNFPDERSFRQLDADHVKYVVLHTWPERRDAYDALSADPRFMFLGEFQDSRSTTALLFRRRD